MKEKKSLLLDVDDVVCFPGFLHATNEFLGTHYTIDDVSDYFIDRQLVPEADYEEFTRFIREKNLYDTAELLPGAKECIEILYEYYQIYFCSSCINPFDLKGSGKLFQDKYDYLIREIPIVSPKNYIFTSVKNMFRAFAQVDDLVSNLDNEVVVKILFPSYHNGDLKEEMLVEKNILRAGYDWREGWQNTKEILMSDKVLNLKNIDNTFRYVKTEPRDSNQTISFFRRERK